jgi:PqqD family protein of HPr-rel-A system
MRYSLHKGLQYRQLGNQCLVYSNQSRETLLVHSMAFRIIELINQVPQTFESLCEAMANTQDISASEEQAFIRVTLEKFTDLGIIKCIH